MYDKVLKALFQTKNGHKALFLDIYIFDLSTRQQTA